MTLRVRMYRQGLGDCFLLTCTDGDETSHLLIDCGVLKGTPDAQHRMQGVAESIRDTTGGRVDRLIVTHEHWDHLSGFLQAQAIFDAVEVGEVWLAWTEDPEDELANELRARKQKRLNGLVAAAQLAEGKTAERLDALLGFEGDLGAAGSQTTGKALEWVKARDAEVKFLRPGDQLFDVPGLEGIRVYVLGPPHDRRLIKRSDPSKKHPEVYELASGDGSHQGFLAAVEALAADEQPGAPFDPFFRVDAANAAEGNELWKRYHAARGEWRRIDGDWLGYAGPLALQLDSDTNNTSLVLAFELSDGGDVLLFPGDAQVGNWLSWESLEWHVGDRTVRSDDLLARTVLYKVGHHGSHNATLREKGLELMASGELTAMIPVNRETAKKMDWLMPFPSLLQRLEEKTKGRVLDAELGAPEERPAGWTASDWRDFLAKTEVQPLWIDYTLECRAGAPDEVRPP
jgi:hypothetical protein